MLGLERGTVRLVPHAELWHRLFAQERAGLREATGDKAVLSGKWGVPQSVGCPLDQS